MRLVRHGRSERRVRSPIDRVDDARRRDGELAVAVGHEGRVLEDGLLAAAARALEEDLRVRVVGHDGPPTTLDLGRAEGELVGDGQGSFKTLRRF